MKVITYITDLLLFLIAVFLILVLTPINYFFVKKKHRYTLSIAYGIDLFGNYYYAPLFNSALIKNNGYQFGVQGETISYVLGRNLLQNTLSIGGKILVFILTKKHCIDSVIND